MKRNRTILLCILLVLNCIPVAGQEIVPPIDSSIYNDDTVIYESDDAGSYDPSYHYHESAQSDYDMSPYVSSLDSAYWRSQVKDLKYDEGKKKLKDTTADKKNKPEEKKRGNSVFLPSGLQFLWIALAILILAIIVWKIVAQLSQRNIRNREKLVISLDELDEDQIRSMDVETPLEQALRNGDYRTAYRLRYLSVIKLLIDRNLILYRKEKTNYEYLLQLSGKDVYEPFRQLTFNFDGIWYGDLAIDKNKYDELDQYFVTFNNLIKS